MTRRLTIPAPAGGGTRNKGRRRTELGLLNDFVGFSLRIAQDASFRVFAKHSGEAHLKPGRFAAMMVIHNNAGIAPGELGRAIGRDKSTVTPLIQELERHGLVAREIASDDRRRVALNLTKEGETALKTLRQHAREHDRKLDAIVGDKKAEFMTLLKKIATEIS